VRLTNIYDRVGVVNILNENRNLHSSIMKDITHSKFSLWIFLIDNYKR